jgi:hypothetical protein
MAENLGDPLQPGQRALWPAAWRYYNTIVAGTALLLMMANVLIGSHLFSDQIDHFISMGISALTAILIWLRERGRQLGVIVIHERPKE